MKRILFVLAAALAAGGCGGDKPAPVAGQTVSDATLRQNCADPKWREENLGLWYSVCRPSANW